MTEKHRAEVEACGNTEPSRFSVIGAQSASTQSSNAIERSKSLS